MAKSIEKIREKMAQLQSELEAAQAEETAKRRKVIANTAERAGLAELGLSAQQLESEFREIARRYKSTETTTTGPQQSTDQAGVNGPYGH